MKIIVLHGDHIEDSYKRLQRFVGEANKRGWEVNRISLKDNLSLSEQMTSKSLFEKESLHILEDLTKIGGRELEWLKNKSENIEGTLVIYHKSLLPKTILNSLPKLQKTEEFKLPVLIWKFFDSFYPGNANYSLGLLHSIIETNPIEFIFALLARHVRDLYWVTLDDSNLPLPSWRLSKLKTQAGKFEKGQLKNIINEFAEMDIKSKTSKANLLDELDFLIITQLKL